MLSNNKGYCYVDTPFCYMYTPHYFTSIPKKAHCTKLPHHPLREAAPDMSRPQSLFGEEVAEWKGQKTE